jgi:hypothetical protein
MKAIRSSLLILFLLVGNNLFSQANLSITDLFGLPSSGNDTAFYNTPYNNIQITIQNTGLSFFQGEVDVLIMGNQQIVDSLYIDSIAGTALNPNDSTVKIVNSYLFNSVHFVDGDNIVVVWPQARSGGISSDTLSFHLYYVSFQSINELSRKPLSISPNPGTDLIRLGISEIIGFEQVRIYNAEGRLQFESHDPQEMIRIKDWQAGLYFIEVSAKNTVYSGRLIIQ